MLQPRRLIEGPEYPGSLEAARSRGLPRFDGHVQALLYVARINPSDSTAFLDERLRVRESADLAHGYRVALFFEVEAHQFVTHLKWIDIGRLEPEVDPWDPSP